MESNLVLLFILYVPLSPLVTLHSPTSLKIAVLNGASAIGRVVPNMLIYRFGAFNVMVPCVYMTSILIFCSLAINNIAGTMVFAILYGFFSGACECPWSVSSGCQKPQRILRCKSFGSHDKLASRKRRGDWGAYGSLLYIHRWVFSSRYILKS